MSKINCDLKCFLIKIYIFYLSVVYNVHNSSVYVLKQFLNVFGDILKNVNNKPVLVNLNKIKIFIPNLPRLKQVKVKLKLKS